MENLDFNIEKWQDKNCPPINCKKKTCECGLEKVFLPATLGDDSKDSQIAPKNGAYCDAIVVYEANGHIYIYSKEGIPTLITSGGGGDYDEIIKEIQEDLTKTEGDLAQEVLDRAAGDKTLQDEIDDMKNSPDVVDIVATYAALQAYDTSKLGDNDIIRVLADETHDGQSTYYRWDKHNSTWTYIGTTGDYYTKGQVDTLLADKQDKLTAGANVAIAQVDNDLVISATNTTYTAGTNVSISSGNVISATDTTYSDFVGTDGINAGAAGLVPAPTTADAGKFLKADGTWDTAGGGGGDTVYSTVTTSNTNNGGAVYIGNLNSSQEVQPDPTSVDEHVKYFWALPFANNVAPGYYSVNILGAHSSNYCTVIGSEATAPSIGQYGTAIGYGATVRSQYGVAIGASAYLDNNLAHSVALGDRAVPTRAGEVCVGQSLGQGYNNTNYRVIGGVHDGQLAHDVVTVNQVNSVIDAINTALSTNISHIGA